MESNKEDARRAKGVAEKKFEGNDLAGAKKFALKAQQMYPSLEGLSHLIAVIDVHIAAADGNHGGIPNWYAILQVSSSADETAIKKQYRRLALLLHPDKNKSVGAEAAFKLIGEASRLLSNPDSRAAYDHNQGRGRDPASAFWTICTTCYVRLQFHSSYLNCYLICPQCGIPFMAVRTAAPEPQSARPKSRRKKKENQMPAGNNDQVPSNPRPSKGKGTENHMHTRSNGQGGAAKSQPFQEECNTPAQEASKPQSFQDKGSNTPAQNTDQAATEPRPPKCNDKETQLPACGKDQAAPNPQPPKDKENQMRACNKDQAAAKPQPPKDKQRQMPACNKDQAATKPQPPKTTESQMPACNKDQAATKPQPPKDNYRSTQKNDQATEKPVPTKEKENHRPAHNKDKASRKSQPSKENQIPTQNKDRAATKPHPPKEKENSKKRKAKKDNVKFDRTAFDRLFAGVVRTPLDEQSNKKANIQVN